MPIDPNRIATDIEEIARFSEHADGDGPESSAVLGYSRPTFSTPWRAARDYVIAEAEGAGAEARTDAAGNVHIRHRSVGWERRVWLSGSHIDSVPSGGKYDGVMGVVVPLEIIRAFPEAPLELVVFAEEEGTTFNLGMLGSRLWAGHQDPEVLGRLRNRHGQTAAEAGLPHGLDPDRLRAAYGDAAGGGGGDWTVRLDPDRYVGMIEVHAEQGLSLWDSGKAIAAVDRINGRRQFEITLTGQANHAGSTGMPGRRDALAGAAEIVAACESLGRELDRELRHTVMTVGRLQVAPGAVNVIPGRVEMSVDFRAQEEELLDRGETRLREIVTGVARRRGLSVGIERSERVAPSPLAPEVVSALVDAAAARGRTLPVIPSGALHDAAMIAGAVPTAMVFVASRDGISHNPDEFSRVEDIAAAAELVADVVRSGS
mgnify:CR=1 FL=1